MLASVCLSVCLSVADLLLLDGYLQERWRARVGNRVRRRRHLRRQRLYDRRGGELTHDTIRYDTRCCFNVRSKADISQLNLPHGTNN